jgi:phage baseplate assembly protein V
MNALAELTRRLDNLIRPGTIAEVDHGDPAQQKPPLCRVQTGNITTGWLKWFVSRAGSTRDWDPVTVGEQCVVFSPSGEPDQGFALVGLYSTANPAPSNSPNKHLRRYPDGAVVEYDHSTHHLRAILPAAGTNSEERLAHCSRGRGLDHSMISAAVRQASSRPTFTQPSGPAAITHQFGYSATRGAFPAYV